MRTIKRETKMTEQTLTIGFSELVELLKANGIEVLEQSTITLTVYNPATYSDSYKKQPSLTIDKGGDISITVNASQQMAFKMDGATPEAKDHC